MSSELKVMFGLLIGRITLSLAVSKNVASHQSVGLRFVPFDAKLEEAVA